ncbi:hypothetical protein ASE08_17730 [Rhizobacter sp. Root16D2]|nr:hypothetical protein ASC88_08170 [Rhizobacter sp. Root29]KQW15189.1 hypothetical protein ASC98_13745 [Rhizobacter sp. Root1238]KRB24353.1 hypothetical protein ASE08_17730 [Rhizobacter sp. Root16D2]
MKLGISEGNALVAFTVGTEGEVVGKEVKSATQPMFGEAALAIVSRLRCDKHSISWQYALRFAKRLSCKPPGHKFRIPLSFSIT